MAAEAAVLEAARAQAVALALVGVAARRRRLGQPAQLGVRLEHAVDLALLRRDGLLLVRVRRPARDAAQQ